MFENKVYKNNLCSIIVTFQTKINEFSDILEGHLDNFTRIIIVNNSHEIDLSCFQSSRITLINNLDNIGLAAAINIGILEAKKQGFNMVALFDQDTVLPRNFSKDMLQHIYHFRGDKPVAVYSPIFHNHVTNEISKHISFKPFRLIRRGPVSKKTFALPTYVITSGSMIPINILDRVGLMREELFIDFVDIEWCLRARRFGLDVVSFNNVMINHHLGDYAISIMGHHYPIHSPLRMYYFFRNAIYLYRLREIDWNWRLVDSARNLFRFLFYMLFVKDRPTYFKFIIKGYYHGLIKRMGKFEE